MSFTHAGQYGPQPLMNASGGLLRSTSVSVANTDGTLASIYADRTKGTAAANPTLSDSNGNLTFFADPGLYDITANGETLRVEVSPDAADTLTTDALSNVTPAGLGTGTPGSSTSPARGDHVHPSQGASGSTDQTTADYTSSAPGDATAHGTTNLPADAGHKHGRESFYSSNPAALGTAAAGSSPSISHGDHVHPAVTTQMLVFSLPGVVATGTQKPRLRFPFACTVLGLSLAIDTAPTGQSMIVDVLKNGTTLYGTNAGNKPTIAAGAHASSNAGGGSNGESIPDTTAIAAGDYLQIDPTQVGSTVAGSDLTLMVRYQ